MVKLYGPIVSIARRYVDGNETPSCKMGSSHIKGGITFLPLSMQKSKHIEEVMVSDWGEFMSYRTKPNDSYLTLAKR